MGKDNIRKSKKPLTDLQKKARLDSFLVDDPDTYSIDYCWGEFIVERETRGNSKASLDAYKRFYKKYCAMLSLDADGRGAANLPVTVISDNAFRKAFIDSLKMKDGSPVSQQTINHYLRSYRAFGNFCEEEGYIPAGFKCPIKEIEPPPKDVYTDDEIKKLLKEPDIENHTAYRSFAIITLILTTGARSNTIRNIRISDYNSETGYITFTVTKTNKPIQIGLDPKCARVINKYIRRWRSFGDTNPTDFLFCNQNEEQISRDGLAKSIAEYNKDRGVNKTSIHLLRHTFAKNWIKDGGDIITLAKVLTHSELEMVKRYSNLYSTDLKAAVEQHSTISKLGVTNKKRIKTRTKE